jgi:S-formylglutathione hydrolase FrmB
MEILIMKIFSFRNSFLNIEKTYRVRSEKRFRAIAGLFIAGGGSIIYDLHYPELFSTTCPLSTGNRFWRQKLFQ